MPATQRKIADQISECPPENPRNCRLSRRVKARKKGAVCRADKSFHGDKAWIKAKSECAPVVSIYGWLPVWFWQERVSVHWSMWIWPKNWPLIVCWYREHSAVSAPTPSYFILVKPFKMGQVAQKGEKETEPKTRAAKTGETAAIPEVKLAAEIGA